MEDLTILLCDDSDDVRSHFCKLLQKCNVKKIFQLTDGSEVVDFIVKNFSNGEEKIDLLITDYIMPEMDGLTLVKNLREYSSKNTELEKFIRELPIIVATSEGETNSMLSFVEAGVNTYIIKPCDKVTLIEKVNIALEK